METKMEQNRLVIDLEGRLDSANVQAVQEQIDAALAAHPGCEPMIDAGGLQYISSAGLRMLLTLRKRLGGLTVQNVLPEVYEILQTTGFTELLDVKKKLREISVDGCDIIGRGVYGTVYRVDDDTIVKVYESPESLPMIENEQRRAKQAFLNGIPTAISYDVVKVGEQYGSVFELLRARTYNDLIVEQPERLEEIVREYAHFVRGVHAVEMEPGELPEARDVFLRYLDDLSGVLPEDLSVRLRALFEEMPEDIHVIHGDIHMKNIMLSGGEPLLIDMDTLSVGDPVFDLMSAYVTYVEYNEDDPLNNETFLGIGNDASLAIWQNFMKYYFDDRDAAVIPEAERRIRIVAGVRFLHLLCVQKVGRSDLMEVRVKHTLEHLRELVDQVEGLAVGALK